MTSAIVSGISPGCSCIFSGVHRGDSVLLRFPQQQWLFQRPQAQPARFELSDAVLDEVMRTHIVHKLLEGSLWHSAVIGFGLGGVSQRSFDFRRPDPVWLVDVLESIRFTTHQR